jgi:hypothetical protein
MCRGKNAVHHLREYLSKMPEKKISMDAIRAPTPTRENPPKGSKIQPRSDGHRSTPVPLPSKQEEVKPNRHLGEMSAVNKVPEKQREGIRPENDEGNSAHAPKMPEKPNMALQDNDNGDVHMSDGTEEEEKENAQPNRTNN